MISPSHDVTLSRCTSMVDPFRGLRCTCDMAACCLRVIAQSNCGWLVDTAVAGHGSCTGVWRILGWTDDRLRLEIASWCCTIPREEGEGRRRWHKKVCGVRAETQVTTSARILGRLPKRIEAATFEFPPRGCLSTLKCIVNFGLSLQVSFLVVT